MAESWPALCRVMALFLASCGGAASAEKSSSTAAGNDERGFSAYAATHGIATLNGDRGSSAEPTAEGLRLERVLGEKPVKLDGVLAEWPEMAAASRVISGSASAVAMRIGLQYDEAKLYVGAAITDAAFSAGRDHVSLTLAVPEPGGSFGVVDFAIFAGQPGVSEGSVRSPKRGLLPGAKVVEAPSGDGYSIEAAIPWGALGEARVTRVGIHGVARYIHGENVVVTGPGDAEHPLEMPWIPSEPELAMIDQLLAPKGLAKTAPVADLVGDLTGDGMRERVAVFEHFLTICGTSYLGGSGFFFRDLGGELVKLEVRDLTGRGHPDVIVRRRVSVGDAKREYLEILDVPDASQEPRVTFAHEIAIEQSDRRVDNSVRMGRGEIDVSIEPATRWDALSYAEPTAGDVEPILLPWGPVRSQAWRWDGSRFVKAKAVTQRERGPQGAASAAAERVREFPERPAEPPTPTVERGGNLSSQVLESYRADRGVSASLAPKADLKVQVTGDARPERVLLIGRDLVVLGPGFKEGTGYLYTTLGQFTEPGDIKEVSARDVTGDGAADIIVRGERRLGEGPSSVTSEVMFVYTLQGDSLRRIFGIETGRERSKKRIQSLVQFVPSASGGSFDVLAAPGRAVGWTEKTYPFSRDVQDSEIEPLLLPWEAIRSVRYTWNGSQFIKSTTSP